MPGALMNDPDGYRRLAENLIAHGTFGEGDTPTAYRPPLYPLMLTGCVALGEHARVAIGVLHVLLGVATVGLVLLLGRWWGLGNRGAAIAALLVACDPILLSQSAQVMTETPAAFLATLGLVMLTLSLRQSHCYAWTAMTTGIALGLGALCRPTFLLWTIVAGAALVYFRWRSASYRTLAFMLGVLIVLSPWAIRNQIQFGRPIVATTHGGYTLLLANNPEFYQWLRSGSWGSVWQAGQFNAAWERRAPRDEVQADRLAYAEAWQTIRREPAAFAYACLVRIGRFWSPLPHQVVSGEALPRRLFRYAVAVWYVLEFLLAAIGIWHICRSDGSSPPSTFRLPLSPWLHGLLLVACLTAVHAVFWTDMRMRSAAMPVVALTAAAAFAAKQSDARK